MSAGYATKLSYRDDLGGQLGDPELQDTAEDISAKTALLSEWLSHSNSVVVFTGAGISTSCGIPDFRGPSGIWTLQRAHKPIPEFKVSFGVAKPSLTHQALVALLHAGKLKYLVSQNVDGLHLRSGIPRDQLAELHGNCFAERCVKCKKEYIRDFEMETMLIQLGTTGHWQDHICSKTPAQQVGFKYTGRRCTASGCNGRLKDQVLDWEDALPEDELTASEKAAAEADLAICLGTSLQITPACNIPLKTTKAGGRLVIINLQKTPKDKKADLVIHAKCDAIMQQVVAQLGIPLPPYTRRDAVCVSHTVKAAKSSEDDTPSFSCTVLVHSIHGVKCPLPLVQQVDISFEDAAVRPASIRKQPFAVTRRLSRADTLHVHIQLHLKDVIEDAYRVQSFTHVMTTSAAPPQSIGSQETYAFTTQTAMYSPGKSVNEPSNTSAGLEHNIQPLAKRFKSSSIAL